MAKIIQFPNSNKYNQGRKVANVKPPEGYSEMIRKERELKKTAERLVEMSKGIGKISLQKETEKQSAG